MKIPSSQPSDQRPRLEDAPLLHLRSDVLEQRREVERRLARRKRTRGIVGGILTAALLATLVAVLTISGVFTGSGPVDPDFPPIDGVPCQAGEALASHYHTYLELYINGKNIAIPANIGIAGTNLSTPNAQVSCFYWLHTHDTSGLIHIEVPANQRFTLGNFLDLWSEKFPHVDGHGFPAELSQQGWTTYISGVKQPTSYDFRTIAFKPHLLITLAYNSPSVQPKTVYNWGSF
ncbi:MAG TPA: hypothetical protein VFU49_23925 [Ktedonobacteraceae bacterium]|nr:hypothetical protein [Ktedonobacteraceae bacterium]